MKSCAYAPATLDKQVLLDTVCRRLRFDFAKNWQERSKRDLFQSVALTVRDRLVERLLATEARYQAEDAKRLYYLSIEFLIGRSLSNNLINLNLFDLCREGLAEMGVDFDEIQEKEMDEGLGNGGLGRLAACYLDSLATLGLPGLGYGIHYEYGLFHQEIQDGGQVAIQLNDTHPALAVAELMRILVDENNLPWDAAWEITRATVAFTNHTLLPEALEKWPVDLLGRVLPRHLQIIYEINRRFLEQVSVRGPHDVDRISRMSLVEERPVKLIRMAHLAVVEEGVELPVPKVYVFAGKAAPGYWAAKQIIKLVNYLGEVINQDHRVRGWLQVVFVPDYRVSLAEQLIPAADLSEQISTAGLEASGTGNMKFALNGALTMGTLDGVNIEILEEVGEDNIYIFGLTADDIAEMRQQGSYHPWEYYQNYPDLRRVLEALRDGRFSPGEPDLFSWIFASLLDHGDPYFHLADLGSYREAQARAGRDYQDPALWARKAILNVARMGKFSSDRSIREYAWEIWDLDLPPEQAGSRNDQPGPSTPEARQS